MMTTASNTILSIPSPRLFPLLSTPLTFSFSAFFSNLIVISSLCVFVVIALLIFGTRTALYGI